jgi:hypothetical protein
MEREPPQEYDVLILDAFSGDAIPVHLLTREALGLFRLHLKRDGILALNVTNRYVDVKPVLRAYAEHAGMAAAVVKTGAKPEIEAHPAEWVLLAQRPEAFERPPIRGSWKPLAASRHVPMWTDDYSSVVKVLK